MEERKEWWRRRDAVAIIDEMKPDSIHLLAVAAWIWCVPSGFAQDLTAVDTRWEPRFAGIEVTRFEAAAPRPLRGVALRLDLRAPGIEFFATPANGGRPGETDAARTSTFLKAHQLQAAINAAPFDVVHGGEGGPQDVQGLLISEGTKISAAQALPALLISKENRAWIADPPVADKGAWNAVGGFAVILRGGTPTSRGDAKLHPRTAAGVSKDGRWLWCLVVDGRQPGFSEGVSTGELALLLKHLGAWDAINLDGGGTSALVVAGPEGEPRVLNRPIHAGIPGLERPAGCHLGVRARPLPEEVPKKSQIPQ